MKIPFWLNFITLSMYKLMHSDYPFKKNLDMHLK